MRLRKAKRQVGWEINIAPLIDVVFLLIIFFMTVAQIKSVEIVPIELPEAKTREQAQTGRLVINVWKRDGVTSLNLDGRPHTFESLHSMLAIGAQNRKPGDVEVLLRGDRNLDWSDAARVLQTLAANRIDRVRIAVVQPAGGIK